MKKKIAILLAAVMTATMVPVTAFAESSNNISQVVTVKDGDFNDEVVLRIQPSGEVKMDDTIILTLENGEFDEDDMKNASGASVGLSKYDYKALGSEETYDFLKAEFLEYEADMGFERAFAQVFQQRMQTARTVDLPYKLRRNTKKEMEVTLFAIPDVYAGEKFADVNKPLYKIPLPFTADGTGTVTVTIDSNGTSIRGGQTHPIANSAKSSGESVTTIDEIKVGSDDIKLGVISVRESVYGTFEPGKKVTMKLNSGFEFKDPTSKERPVTISAGINAEAAKDIKDASNVELDKNGGIVLTSVKGHATIDGQYFEYEFNENSFDFTIPKLSLTASDGKSSKPAALKFDGLWVTPEDDDNMGEIKLTISGTSAGITKETINVAERGDYGFVMKNVEDATTIYAGRKGNDTVDGSLTHNDLSGIEYTDRNHDKKSEDLDDYISADAFKEYDSDDYLSATVEFYEVTADSWNTNRKLKFTVPDEIKIYNFEIDEEEDCSHLQNYAKIKDDGHTLEIDLSGAENKEDIVDPNEASKFELQLTLSADANFEGDVPLSVTGGGVTDGEAEDVVIAKVVKPVSLETSTTKTNMGYQKIDAADIVLTEAEGGMLVKNGEVRIAIDSVYGDSELGFADEDIDYEIDGDLKITKFRVKDGYIRFEVDSASVDASKITIKNVKIGTTRSVPQGNYGLKVSGSAIINNYSEGMVDEGCESGEKGLGYFDDNDAIKFANYIDVVTETGTLDKVVKVTIDEKNVLVGEESYEMPVAPYIQPESNSTLVPLRFVAVALLGESPETADQSTNISFDAVNKVATITYAAGTNRTIIQFTAGSNLMKINGTDVAMDNGVKAEIKDGRMFVPFRAIGQAVGVNVGWDADTRTATYNAQ